MSLRYRLAILPTLTLLSLATPALAQLTQIGSPISIASTDPNATFWLATRPGGFAVSAHLPSSPADDAKLYQLDANGALQTTTTFVTTKTAFEFRKPIPISSSDGIFLAMYKEFPKVRGATYEWNLYDLPATLDATVTDPIPFYTLSVGSMEPQRGNYGVSRPWSGAPFGFELPVASSRIWRFTGNGTPIDLSPTLLPQTVDIAVSGDTSFAVIKAEFDIFALHRYDADGEHIDSTVITNISKGSGLPPPTLAALLDGGYLVTWPVPPTDPEAIGSEYRFRIYERDGTARTDEIVALPDALEFQLLTGEAGDFHMIWTDAAEEVWVRTYDPYGRAIGGDFPGVHGEYVSIPGGRLFMVHLSSLEDPHIEGRFFQSPTLHADGFESGNASRWSASTP